MNIKPVEININNNFQFGIVAFFVDKPYFMRCLVTARRILGINNPIPREEVKNFLFKAKLNSKLPEYFISESKIPEKLAKFKRNGFEVFADIYQTYQGYYPWFADVIFFSIINNSVEEEDIKSEPLFFEPGELNEELGLVKLGFPGGAITIYPFSTDQQVLDLLHKYRKSLKIPDTIANIRRDRIRYWLNQPIKKGGEGQSHYKIALSEANGNSSLAHNSVRGIGVSIKQYKDRLNVQL